MREVAKRKRRKAGVQAVKGTQIKCAGCGITVVLNRSPRAKYCRQCYLLHNGLDARERSKRRQSTQEGREANNAWQRNRRRSDPRWSVSAHVRVLMHRALGSGKAGRSWRSLVPYSLEDLVAHIERQFLPGMTWDNRGEWHIDHIQPLASFSFETAADHEFKAAWALSNLRPWWATDNLKKSAKRLYLV